ncbi:MULTISPECIES: phage baseplate assembly protein V [unclassified Frankia]|uniref:phage baseplate assembly protein V n=1 Tax=unclassified Frankia TaxID=2632575 RepID=UPI002AD57DD3|nr:MULTISPECIES: phage baseplate assembly protein V [unclassified Frankia]
MNGTEHNGGHRERSRSGSPRFQGRYRGTVTDDVDPNGRGRLQVAVPDVLGDDPCIWAESASPLVGQGMGIYAIPRRGAGVWVEFEDGDPDHAIWTGGWRGGSEDVPAAVSDAPPSQQPIVIRSEAGNEIILANVAGQGITLQTSAGDQGPRIVITQTAITLTTGNGASIELTGPSVKINNDALTVDAP